MTLSPEFFRFQWIKGARLENVGEAVVIEGQKDAAQWAVRGLAQLVGIIHIITDWTRETLLTFLVADAERIGIAAAFGFGPFDVERETARQAAAKRIAASA